MASPETSNQGPAPFGTVSNLPNLAGEWVKHGIEGFIATQKILLDLMAQQNALALTIVRERLGFLSPAPSKTLMDLTGRGLTNFLEAQKVVLDMASKQATIVKDGLQPGIAGTPVEGLAEVINQGLENFISAQKGFLEFVESETQGAVADAKEGKGFDPARLSHVANEGVKTFLRTQKKFLEIIEQQVDKPRAPMALPEGARVDVFAMAKDSVDAVVEGQKRLMDLASDQIDVNVKFVNELFSFDSGSKPPAALPDILKKSVDSFMAAQKALSELAAKPRKTAEDAVKDTMKTAADMVGAA
jgi:hypothetical protein